MTLFEGGKVAGEDVVADLISELKSSVQSTIKLEGEMIRLTNCASALAMALECVKVLLDNLAGNLMAHQWLGDMSTG